MLPTSIEARACRALFDKYFFKGLDHKIRGALLPAGKYPNVLIGEETVTVTTDYDVVRVKRNHEAHKTPGDYHGYVYFVIESDKFIGNGAFGSTYESKTVIKEVDYQDGDKIILTVIALERPRCVKIISWASTADVDREAHNYYTVNPENSKMHPAFGRTYFFELFQYGYIFERFFPKTTLLYTYLEEDSKDDLTDEVLINLMISVFKKMLYMHNQGVCHLDLCELNNILYDKSTGDVNFVDFGASGQFTYGYSLYDKDDIARAFESFLIYNLVSKKTSASTREALIAIYKKVDANFKVTIEEIIAQLESLKANLPTGLALTTELPPKNSEDLALATTVRLSERPTIPATTTTIKGITTFQPSQNEALLSSNPEREWTANRPVWSFYCS
jgi:serine/threonine protein kinase